MPPTWLTAWRRVTSNSLRQRAILVGEDLEQRCVPDGKAFVWDLTASSYIYGNWGAADFWREQETIGGRTIDVVTSDVPGAGDTVIFDPAYSNKGCVVNALTTVASINIRPGFTGYISLSSNLEVTDNLTMRGGTIKQGKRMNKSLFTNNLRQLTLEKQPKSCGQKVATACLYLV